MSKRIVIIGAGLAGAIAYSALRHYKPLVLEAGPERDRMSVHPAVMRLRDPSVAQFIGARFEEITVQKAIFFNGRTYNEPNIFFNNLYSMKLYKELGRRSLKDLGDNKRFILPEGYPVPDNIQWNTKVKEVFFDKENDDQGHIYWNEDGSDMNFRVIWYDYCISTLPMTKMVEDICVPGCYRAIFLGDQFKSLPVHVMHLSLPFPSTVHQTVYFPSPGTQIYRITVSGRQVIVEAMDTFNIDEAEDLIMNAFGIGDVDSNSVKTFTMPIGKMMGINEDQRRRYIMWLTSQHNIFSFGRFSVWRPLRTDQLLGDIEKIKRWISATDTENEYKGRLNST